jgi:hypothetical protein
MIGVNHRHVAIGFFAVAQIQMVVDVDEIALLLGLLFVARSAIKIVQTGGVFGQRRGSLGALRRNSRIAISRFIPDAADKPAQFSQILVAY